MAPAVCLPPRMTALPIHALRPTLAAVVHCLLSGAPEADASVRLVTDEVVRRIGTLDAGKQSEIAQALSLLNSRLVGLATVGSPVSFASGSPALQQLWLSRWANAPVPALRSAFQAFRRLVLAAHYGQPHVARAIGHAGPLHLRDPEVAWEGPLATDHTGRTGSPAAGAPPRMSPIAAPVDTTVSAANNAAAASSSSTSSSATSSPAAWRRVLTRTVPPPGVIVASDVVQDQHRTADAVVIGTGAGGAVAAARLAAAGLEVVILEEGGYYAAADFTEEEVPLAEQLYADGAMRATDDLAVQLLQGRAVGGSTTINWMIMLRTPDFVLEEWQRVHGLTDLHSAAMSEFFSRIEHEVHACEVPANAHSPNNRVLINGARALGWRVDNAVINAKGCMRSGFCGIGCRYDAKQGTLVTYVPRALAHGATLYADAHAQRIERRERDTGERHAPMKRVHVQLKDRITGAARHKLVIDAPLVIVAGGAVGTPVLLQRSGLADGPVGRYLRLHPTTATVGVFDHEIVGSAGIPLSAMCSEHLQWKQSNYGFWLECPPFLPALGAVAAPGFGVAHAKLMQQFRHLSSVIALTRDGADMNASSGEVSINRRGHTSIRYALTPADAERVQASIEAAARLQLAAGAREVHTLHTNPLIVRSEADLAAVRRAPVSANRLGLFSAHVNGTCRMGTNPRTAATTPDGERFGVRGLYIADGSLLPTALGVNPQATIMALATMISERVAVQYGPSTSMQGAFA